MMTRLLLGGVALLIFSVSHAFADSQSTDITYSASAYASGASPTGSSFHINSVSDEKSSAQGDPLTVGNTFDVTDSDDSFYDAHNSFATVGLFGHAAVGDLGAGVAGQTTAQSEGAFLTPSTASSTATVTSGYDDWVEINYPELPTDRPIQVNGLFRLRGSYSGSLTRPVGESATWAVNARLTGMDSGDAQHGATGTNLTINAVSDNGQSGDTVDMEIPISVLLDNGHYDALGEQLTVSGSATVNTNYLDGSDSSDFTDDFKDTLSWGGITSVIDYYTGDPLTGWTINSLSGFDYTQPAPLPEPCALTLILLGSGLLSARRRHF